MKENQICPFCDPNNAVLESELCLTRKDNFPVSPGHVLVTPKRHVSAYFDCTAEEVSAIWEMVEEAKHYIETEFSPDGFNIGINVGAAAGQTVPHVHIHLMPRYDGDMESPEGGVRGVIPSKQKYRKLL